MKNHKKARKIKLQNQFKKAELKLLTIYDST